MCFPESLHNTHLTKENPLILVIKVNIYKDCKLILKEYSYEIWPIKYKI